MKPRLLLLLILLFALGGCQAPYKKKDEEDKKPFKDQAGDQGFQAFVGRLRRAVAGKNHAMLQGMMAPDFGYRWDDAPVGESPFIYWDKNNLWPELNAVLREEFVPNELYMVAPPAAVSDPNYKGFRAGLRIVNGSWKFAYFVPTQGAQ